MSLRLSDHRRCNDYRYFFNVTTKLSLSLFFQTSIRLHLDETNSTCRNNRGLFDRAAWRKARERGTKREAISSDSAGETVVGNVKAFPRYIHRVASSRNKYVFIRGVARIKFFLPLSTLSSLFAVLFLNRPASKRLLSLSLSISLRKNCAMLFISRSPAKF